MHYLKLYKAIRGQKGNGVLISEWLHRYYSR